MVIKMKIAIIIERTDINLGGAERSVNELSGALVRLGHEVHILAAKGQSKSDNIHFLCQDKPGSRVDLHVFGEALKSHLSQNSYDIVHSVLPFEFADVYQPRGGTYAESVLRNAASYRNKLIESWKKLTAFTNFRRSTLLQAERKLCSGSDGPVIVALSKYVSEQFKRHYNVEQHRIIVIPNGVNTEKQVDEEKALQMRQRIFNGLGLNEADRPVLFLFAATNFRLKGLSCLLEAVKTLTERIKGFDGYVVVVGGAEKSQYKRLAEGRAIFPGSVDDIHNIMSIVDVAALPTFYDPASRFILEALAAGKPVITTKFNGATDLFTNNRHGIVINSPENIESLADAVDYFTNKDNIRNASQAIIKDNLRATISIDRVARELTTLYELILQKKGE